MGKEELFQKDPYKTNSDSTESPERNDEEENAINNLSSEETTVDENNDETSPEAFQQLDHQLDALFVALDAIESKNDNLHAQLLQLLQANREIRKEIQDNQNVDDDDMDN